MTNGYHDINKEEPLRNRSNYLLTDWVLPIVPSSEHSARSSSSSIKSKQGRSASEERKRTQSADSAMVGKSGRPLQPQTNSTFQQLNGNMSSYLNGAGEENVQQVLPGPYHAPPHTAYSPPHVAYHQPHPHPTYSASWETDNLFFGPASPVATFSPALPIHPTHTSMSMGPREASVQSSSRKSKKTSSPTNTITSLDGSHGRKRSVAASSSGRRTPPTAVPSGHMAEGSTAKATGSVPKKRGRPPKVKANVETTPTAASVSAAPVTGSTKRKRARIAEPSLLTPPSSSSLPAISDEIPLSLPFPDQEDTGDEHRSKTLAITTHHTDGRRLDCNLDYVDRQEFSGPRHRGPALVTDDRGTASFDTGDAVSHELAWIESSLPSPPLTAESAVAAKVSTVEPEPVPEIRDTPETRTQNLERRLQGFKSHSNRPQAAETRLAEGGRFIAPGPGLTGLLFNPVGGEPPAKRARFDESSGSIQQPDWPEIPGYIAWPHQDPIREGNRRRELASISRYLAVSESDSDDEMPERFRVNIKHSLPAVAGPSHVVSAGKTVALIDGAPSDALLALKLTMRHRNFGHVQTSTMACDCGVINEIEQAVVQCTSCRDLHHSACYSRRELPNNRWEAFFCRGCRERAMRLATPVQTPRAYAQSDLRSSAFKGDMAHRTEMAGIALQPSPIFPTVTRTPFGQQMLGRAQSPRGPVQSRTLSYNDDPFFNYFEVPKTPAPAGGPRTPYAGGGGFDVMSTPSRHLDYSSLVRYPRPSDTRNRTVTGDFLAPLATPLSGRAVSGSASNRPVMFTTKASSSTPTASGSSVFNAPTTPGTMVANALFPGPPTLEPSSPGPSSQSTSAQSTGPLDSGIGSLSRPHQAHQLLGASLIASPSINSRQRQVSRNNLSTLHVDSRGDFMGPMIDPADDDSR